MLVLSESPFLLVPGDSQAPWRVYPVLGFAVNPKDDVRLGRAGRPPDPPRGASAPPAGAQALAFAGPSPDAPGARQPHPWPQSGAFTLAFVNGAPM
ncbi:hypothetical protein GCM10023195_68440 [Actinoallomurus liliacearum]|uniref:Uncharacterized protein n=1 Tax=Actinoallomurus liliacearum TaxID=1080073 RepID=A0ABP8TSL4_9ACTN